MSRNTQYKVVSPYHQDVERFCSFKDAYDFIIKESRHQGEKFFIDRYECTGSWACDEDTLEINNEKEFI